MTLDRRTRRSSSPRATLARATSTTATRLTAHRAQGATVDRAFVLGSDELYREWGYTAL